MTPSKELGDHLTSAVQLKVAVIGPGLASTLIVKVLGVIVLSQNFDANPRLFVGVTEIS